MRLFNGYSTTYVIGDDGIESRELGDYRESTLDFLAQNTALTPGQHDVTGSVDSEEVDTIAGENNSKYGYSERMHKKSLYKTGGGGGSYAKMAAKKGAYTGQAKKEMVNPKSIVWEEANKTSGKPPRKSMEDTHHPRQLSFK